MGGVYSLSLALALALRYDVRMRTSTFTTSSVRVATLESGRDPEELR